MLLHTCWALDKTYCSVYITEFQNQVNQNKGYYFLHLIPIGLHVKYVHLKTVYIGSSIFTLTTASIPLNELSSSYQNKLFQTSY